MSFNVEIGIRQEDPLSPYIYAIATNIFSTLINQAIEERKTQDFTHNVHR